VSTARPDAVCAALKPGRHPIILGCQEIPFLLQIRLPHRYQIHRRHKAPCQLVLGIQVPEILHRSNSKRPILPDLPLACALLRPPLPRLHLILRSPPLRPPRPPLPSPSPPPPAPH